jgi:hypothetical protein
MLAHMRAPVDLRISVSYVGGGGVFIQQTLEQEGPDAIYRDVRAQFYTGGSPYIKFHPDNKYGDTNIPQVAQQSWHDAASYAAVTQNQVQRRNAAVTDLNQRIEYALSRATGEKIEGDPALCQRWWTNYCCNYYELEQTSPSPSTAGLADFPYPSDYEPQGIDYPVIEKWQVSGAPAPVSVSVSICSCFAWNTKVWTLTGPLDIARIKPGDRVLSQQPFTGELSYQPVLQVTRRKPSPMIEIGLGRETLRATRGHPFWGCGEGWKMAKELAAGMRLHSTDGPILIDRVEQVPAARPWYEQPDAKAGEDLSYNLVLDECHNFFVGPQRVLVHDNTLFPLDGPVPGVPGLGEP